MDRRIAVHNTALAARHAAVAGLHGRLRLAFAAATPA